MEAAADLIAALVEFTAGMKHGEHNLESALVLFLVHIHGNAAAVVDNGYGIVGIDCHFYVGGIAGNGFIDGVVHDLVHQMVQAFFGYVAYIHRRALAHGLKAFEHLNVTGAVFLFFVYHILLL